MKKILAELISKNLRLQYIDVVNNSRHHIGHDGYGENSHFEITIVSNEFKNLSRIKRHRLIFDILKMEEKKIHSISLKLYTEEEYES